MADIRRFESAASCVRSQFRCRQLFPADPSAAPRALDGSGAGHALRKHARQHAGLSRPPPPPPPAADRSDTPDAGDAPPKTVDSKPAVRANGKARDGTTTNANADTSGAADDAPQVDAKPSVNSGKTVTAKVKADADAIDTGKPADGKPSDAKSADKTVVDAPASNATPANPPDLTQLPPR